MAKLSRAARLAYLAAVGTLACSRSPQEPVALPPAPACSPAPLVATAPAAALPPSPAVAVPIGDEEQSLSVAIANELTGAPLTFRNRTLLTTSSSTLELVGDRVQPSAPNAAGPIALATAGTFPTRAFLLTSVSAACTMPDKNVIQRWNGKRWAAQPSRGPERWPREQVVDLCNWGEHELALHLERWHEERASSRFEVLDDAAATAPVFEAASQSAERHCGSRLLAQRCVGLASGGVVTIGTLCTEETPALAYYASGNSRTTIISLPPAEAFELTHVATWGDDAYIGGKHGWPRRAYLTQFSPAGGARSIALPAPVASWELETLVATQDGSLWLNLASAPSSDGVGEFALWRRDRAGSWHLQGLPSAVPDSRQKWTESPPAGPTLVGAWGELWFNAVYRNGPAERASTSVREYVLSTKLGLAPFQRSRAARFNAAAAPVTSVPCAP